MELPIAYYGNPILRKKAKPVEKFDDELKQLVRDMAETMHKNNGMGLAATQVSKELRLFITYVSTLEEDGSVTEGTLKVYINPEILEVSKETTVASEGCLSIPEIRGDVERPLRVKIKAQDLEGNSFTEEVFDYEAHCILHENDHINGVLYIDRIYGKERKLMEPKLRQIKKKYHLCQK